MSQTEIIVYAAGSLKSAMTEIITAFQQAANVIVHPTFGAAGGLREKIESGEPCDIFLSANMKHPQKLLWDGRAVSIVRFAGNELCAVKHPNLPAYATALRAIARSPSTRIGISTPINDPCGDYAVEFLQKIGVDPNESRIIRVTGGKGAKIPRADGLSDYTGALADGAVDMLLIYQTLAARVLREMPAAIMTLPPDLAVSADYGLALLPRGGHTLPQAREFIGFLLSAEGQGILQKHGFQPAVPAQLPAEVRAPWLVPV